MKARGIYDEEVTYGSRDYGPGAFDKIDFTDYPYGDRSVIERDTGFINYERLWPSGYRYSHLFVYVLIYKHLAGSPPTHVISDPGPENYLVRQYAIRFSKMRRGVPEGTEYDLDTIYEKLLPDFKERVMEWASPNEVVAFLGWSVMQKV
jgi:hypothetical protein